MDIQIDYQSFEEKLSKVELVRLANFVLENVEAPVHTQVSIVFVTEEEIARLNEEYRGIQGPTDVLSFECDGLEDGFDGLAPEGPFLLGDIIIAPDIAEKQAREYEVTFFEEISLLVVHGLLHLLGYDHESDEEAVEMEQLEESLLRKWNTS